MDRTHNTVRRRNRTQVVDIAESPAARYMFSDTSLAWLWLLVRLYAGYEWITAGWEKINSAAWTGSKAGSALTGFIKGALSQTGGAHPNVQGWYGQFLQYLVLPNAAIWGYIVAWGEFLVGVALVLGIFTGIAAFFGAFMNMNYLLAGTVSTNPLLLVAAIFLVLAWRTAGWWGIDRWLLPALGTPWAPGYVFEGEYAPRGGAQVFNTER